MSEQKTWVIVASRDHALRGVQGGFVMANHGKRSPLARMSVGDRVMIYSSKETYPDGAPLKAITVAGEITGEEPGESEFPGAYARAADLRALTPIPLSEVNTLLPTGRLRFGFFELTPPAADAVWSIIEAS